MKTIYPAILFFGLFFLASNPCLGKRSVAFPLSDLGPIKIIILNISKINQNAKVSIDSGAGGQLSDGIDFAIPLNSENYFGVSKPFTLTHLETASGYKLIEPEKGITFSVRVNGPATLKVEVDEDAGGLVAQGFCLPRFNLGNLTTTQFEESFSINHDHPF